MNKLFEKLADTAIEEKLTLEEFVSAITQNPYGYYGFSVEELEKYSQLIVAECVNVVRDGTIEGDVYVTRIERHFDRDDEEFDNE